MDTSKLQQAIAVAGSQSELARRLTDHTGKLIRQGHIWSWLHRTRRVPAEMVIPIEQVVDGAVSRSDLRPDIYPPSQFAA